MSNVETKQIVGRNLYDYSFQLQTLVQAGWVLDEGGIRNNPVTYRARLVRGVQEDTKAEAKVDTVKEQPKTTKAKTTKAVEVDVEKGE